MAAKQTIRRTLKVLTFIIVFDMTLLITTDVGGEQEELLSRIVLPSRPNLSALNCSAYGGPQDASEMVYWHDIPEDATFMEPIDPSEEEKYLSFELDRGGLNNIRTNLETVLALAHATRRTLVLPPQTDIFKYSGIRNNAFDVRDYFTIEEATRGIGAITMEEYLQRQLLLDSTRGFPPNNRTNWDNAPTAEMQVFFNWIRTSFVTPNWNCTTCMLGFPRQESNHTTRSLQHLLSELKSKTYVDRLNNYMGNPVDVDATNAADRLDEVLIKRSQLCEYTDQQAPHIHLRGDQASGTRLMIHFYAFLFFEDWRQDLWIKRLIRDKLRFVDEAQCAAARVVQELRAKSPSSHYNALHIRRGDFVRVKGPTSMAAEDIYQVMRDVFEEGSTLYIASDESNATYFNVLQQHYDVYFLQDFEPGALQGVNPEYYGMIEQLIASRAREFAGCFYSTFTGYIHRMRGYHSQNDYFPEPDGALMDSWYYVPEKHKDSMQGYFPLSFPPYAREFPIAWRDINKGIGRRVE